MVYAVTNPGKVMHPVDDAPLPYKTNADKPVYEVKIRGSAGPLHPRVPAWKAGNR